ncbi:DNA cytosine methyltransferase [Psittacicella gerlachiana]|uniref:Cytosine-specific methyltransferase n=1 Tax=Psittacicella gerlachiana TaxID=2028574 RepID=A0A3A1YI04_9GAMM|nr:DNA cytosine methyltransferase [Psittacicella gerlachiana]RIY36838.1 DNA (cytosine-5-)-methyltransferase [Psittacicella gerlachiana]
MVAKVINSFDKTISSSPKQKYQVVSLFSGLGGLDLGFVGGFEFLGTEFTKNPFEIKFANDIFKQACDIYESNFNHQVTRKSIVDLDLEQDLPQEQIDVVLGGFPCQSFSYSGKRKGLSDERGQLYKQMLKVVSHYRPKMFVAENVDGIRNSKKTQQGAEGNISALEVILEEFRAAGYQVEYQVLNAADFGVPQIRKRVIIIGIRKDLQGQIYYPQQLFSEQGETTPKWISAKEAIDDLWLQVNTGKISNHTIRDISKAKFYPGKKMQGNCKILADRPAPTIRAEHHGNIEAHYRTTLEDVNDMQGWRRLSVRECARLQSFPDNFVFPASASSAYKAIGNAVPPVLAWHIARAVLYSLNGLK